MFNHNTLEKDIERLSREISEKKNLPENKDLSQLELVGEVIKPMFKAAMTQTQASGTGTSQDEDSGLPSYLSDSPEETKLEVGKLVDSVFHQGLTKTLAKAKKSNPFVLDAFHDALANKLYAELKKRKLI